MEPGDKSKLLPPEVERLNSALAGRYAIERELGAGGMSIVYLARDLKHDRLVALKILRPELSAMIGGARFLQEIRVTARLDHPQILTLIDSGASDGLLWYVFPYVRGESLRDRLRRERQLAIDESIRIASQIAGALDYAHRQGVIHRDVKPENILLFEDQAILADFGLALAVSEAGGSRLTQTGISVGTPHYMSPEQATGGHAIDARTDVYSLGAVLYEMLSGQPPHEGRSAQAIIASVMTQDPIPLRAIRSTISPQLAEVVHRALAKVPADRFASAAEFKRALDVPKTVAHRRNRKTLAVGLVSAVIAVAAIAAVLVYSRRSARVQPAGAATQATFTGDVSAAAISPDGNRLAVVSRVCDMGTACSYSLSWRELDGSGSLELLARVAEIGRVGWSPDGRYLVFDGRLGAAPRSAYVISVLGGSPQPLGRGVATFFRAPDSIALGRFAEGKTWLKLSSLGGAAPPESVALTGRHAWPQVSPTGEWVATAVPSEDLGSGIALSDRQGRPIDSLAGPALPVARWSAAGDALYYASFSMSDLAHQRIEQRRIDRRTGRFVGEPVIVADQLGGLADLSVSSAGDKLGYVAGPNEGVVYALSRRARGAPVVQRIISRSTGVSLATLSPDGRHVALLLSAPGGSRQALRIAIVPFDSAREVWSSGPLELANASWTPDGRHLVYAAKQGESYHVFSYSLSSGERRALGPMRGPNHVMLALSADKVLWIGGKELDSLVVQDLRAGTVHLVRLQDSTFDAAYVSPLSGDSLVVICCGTTSTRDSIAVGTLSLTTGRVRRLGTVPASHAAGSPVAGARGIEVPVAEPAGAVALFRIPFDGGRAVRLFDLPFESAYYEIAQDGRMTASVRTIKRDVWILPLTRR